MFEEIAKWFANNPIVRIGDSLGKLAVLAAILAWFYAYLPNSVEKKENDRKLYLWELIHSASGSTADGGRMKALEELVKYGENLNGIDLSNGFFFKIEPAKNDSYEAKYIGLDLSSTSLMGANFNHSKLWWANFKESILWQSTFHCTDLTGVDFSGSYLESADFRLSKDLTCDQLKRGIDWEKSYRDDTLSCDAEIPNIKNSEIAKRDLRRYPKDCSSIKQ